jgi:hypothetical protein
MAAAVNTSIGAGDSGGGDGIDHIETGPVTPSGADRALFAVTCDYNQPPVGVKYDGISGTALFGLTEPTQINGFSWFYTWYATESPNAETTLYADWAPAEFLTGGLSGVFLTGVDQSTPFGEGTLATGDAFDGVAEVSVVVAGLNPGQLAVCALGWQCGGDVASVVSANAETTVVAYAPGFYYGGFFESGCAVLYGTADGSGNLTLAANITEAAISFIQWRAAAIPVNDSSAPPGGTVVNPFTGRGGAAAQPLAA